MSKMHSRELGLVLARQLLDVEDLHYGLWDDDLERTLGNLAKAQQRYNDLLLSALPKPEQGVRVLDIGCGTGQLLGQLLDRGYRADGVIPAKDLSEAVKRKVEGRGDYTPHVYECNFEDFPTGERSGWYDVALFSESFQYISPSRSLPILEAIVKPGGLLLICDFFRVPPPSDREEGADFGGGHPLGEFYASMEKSSFSNLRDEDITRRVSPNMELVNDLLMHRLKPALGTLGRYAEENYPLITRILRALLRKKLDRMNRKYFSGLRNQATFERYKSYRFLLYRRT